MIRPALAVGWLLMASTALAQEPVPLRLSLEEAMSRATRSSETLALAEVAERRSIGEVTRAKAERFPQLTASLLYSRLLRSQFGSLGDNAPRDSAQTPTTCDRFIPDPFQPISERLGALEAAVQCASASNPFALFGDLPFGRKNTYTLGIGLSQTLYAGGRLSAQASAADAGRRRARLGRTTAEAALTLEVVQAYYDALLSDRLLTIAEATLDQADSTVRQTSVAYRAGSAPEFDFLRARVARDNQVPVVIQRSADRRLAYLRLSQLLDLPAERPLALTTSLGDSTDQPEALLGLASPAAPPQAEERVAVRQMQETVSAQEQLLRAARAASYPAIVLSSQFSQIAYPTSGVPAPEDFLTNWTVGVGIQVPLFTGGRLAGERMVAQANLEDARLRYRQVVKQARLDSQDAGDQLRAARARWEASRGTADQAARAYAIALVRFQEGISTQTELLGVRIALQESEWNRARAARDLQVAGIRVALLDRLPLPGSPVPTTQLLSPQSAALRPNPDRQVGAGFP